MSFPVSKNVAATQIVTSKQKCSIPSPVGVDLKIPEQKHDASF